MSRIVVVGDVLLDVDIETDAHRLAPDGAAPVLQQQHRVERAGGAALAAALALVGDQVEVTLVCPLADDGAARRVRAMLDDRIRLAPIDARGQTPVKTRLRCAGHTVARLDEGSARLGVTSVPEAVRAVLRRADAVLVSDYGTGTTHCESVRELVGQAARTVPVIWDPHPRGGTPVRECALVTPNSAEAEVGEQPVTVALQRATELVSTWRARNVAVTLGDRGAVLADDTGRSTYVPGRAAPHGDPCGAGDCFAATAASALSRGATPEEAVGRAVERASDFVAGGGVAGREPAEHTAGAPGVARVRATGGTVVATGGCFDLLHAGHIATLEAARALGDCLIVCLNSDASVRRLKGDGRPLQPATDRARVLRALRCVDEVVVFDEDTPQESLRELRPDVWVKGGDYRATDLPEAPLVQSWGGTVATVPYLSGRSTSALVALSRQ